MLKLRGLQVVRDGTPVLKGVDLEVNRNESVALLGPSGCGKSTLLKALVGGCNWQADEFSFMGHAIQPGSIQKVRLSTGYIGQEHALAGDSVLEALERPFQFAVYRNRSFPKEQMLSLLTDFHLSPELLEKHPATLSGGQRQRMHIIRVLLLNPPLIIADEPTSALDPVSRRQVIKELQKSGRTVISTSHEQDWLNSCSRILTMTEGKITREAAHVQCG